MVAISFLVWKRKASVCKDDREAIDYSQLLLIDGSNRFIAFWAGLALHTFNGAKEMKEKEGGQNAVQCKKPERLRHRRNGW
jgi:hypothetical protein